MDLTFFLSFFEGDVSLFSFVLSKGLMCVYIESVRLFVFTIIFYVLRGVEGVIRRNVVEK